MKELMIVKNDLNDILRNHEITLETKKHISEYSNYNKDKLINELLSDTFGSSKISISIIIETDLESKGDEGGDNYE